MKRKPKNRFRNYFVNKGIILFRIFAILLMVVLVISIIESLGLTYNPSIEVDAYNNKRAISPYLYGFGNGSDFRYNTNLASAVSDSGAQSFRIIDGYNPGARMLVKVDNGVFKVLAADNVAYESGEQYNIKTIVSGTRIKVYVDNKLVFNVEDAKFSQGKIGLLSSYNQETYFDNVSVKSLSGNNEFNDNFNGGISSAWNSNGFPDWYTQGEWSRSSNQYRHIGKQNMAMKMAGSSNWRNYTYSVDMKSEGSNPYDLGYMGMTFRQQDDPLSGYRFMWRSKIDQPYASNIPWGVQDFDGQLRMARETGAEPVVCINMRDSARNAANLVKKLNKENNYNVKYWELGNEPYIWGDYYMPNTVYAKKVKEYSEAMKAVDPSIKIGATLLLGISDWDIEVIKGAADYFDFIVFHFYPFWVQSDVSDHQLLASPYAFGNKYKTAFSEDKGVVEQANDLIKEYAPHRSGKIEFIVSEYNTGDPKKGESLLYGLTVADLMGQFAENGVKIGQFHNASASSDYHWAAFTSDYRKKPAALAISLYAEHFGDILTNTEVKDSPTYSVNEKRNLPHISNVPYLSAYSSKNRAENKLYLSVVNKHNLATMKTDINIKNAKITNKKAKVYTLNGSTINSNNKYSDQVKVTESEINYASKKFSYNFPAHSVTVFEFEMKTVRPPLEEDSNNGGASDQDDIGGRGGSGYSDGETKMVISAGPGGNPHVKTFDAEGLQTGFNQFVYSSDFKGGISAALGDVDGDGEQEIIVGAGKGGGPHVRIFKENGQEIANFFAFHKDFHGGINVAAGDVDYDGKDEVAVVQATEGQAWVKIYRINSSLPVVGEFNAYGSVESGGDVAMGDIDYDGQDEVIVGAGPGGGPHIRVYEANGERKPIQFFAFHPSYRGGVRVAAGDVDGDGKDEIGVTQAALGDQSWVKIYRYNDNQTIIGEWKAYGDFFFGADIDIGDVDGNGQKEVVTGPTLGGGPQVLTFNPEGQMLPLRFYTFDPSFRGGINVSVAK